MVLFKSSLLCMDIADPVIGADGCPERKTLNIRNATMETISVADARREPAIGKQAKVHGWVRTRRDSKGGFSFLELNDGSCQGNLQIVADGKLANYESEIKKLSTGSSVTVVGEVKKSPAKGQATELHAASVTVHGHADPETYPLQKKGHSFEFLR